MKTYSPKPRDIERRWYVLDASGAILGRLATQAATILRGKHKPIFAPHADTGDHVIVINAKEVTLSGGKENKKVAYHHSGYPGGLTETVYSRLLAKKPAFAVEKAIKGMLPHNRLGRQMASKLRVYAGAEHRHEAQQPQPLAPGEFPPWSGLPQTQAGTPETAATRPEPTAPAAKRSTAKRSAATAATATSPAKKTTAKRSTAKRATAPPRRRPPRPRRRRRRPRRPPPGGRRRRRRSVVQTTTGRRKEAVARVRLVPGTGAFQLNGRSLDEYFTTRAHRMVVAAPLRLVERDKDLDVIARIEGGGVSGQAGALRLGIARALIELDPELRPVLKSEGYLSRDPREKERRKYGLKKARKAPQYSKR